MRKRYVEPTKDKLDPQTIARLEELKRRSDETRIKVLPDPPSAGWGCWVAFAAFMAWVVFVWWVCLPKGHAAP
jgi:hypothetical protein